MDGNGYARCDYRMAADGTIYMLEINPNCGIFYSPEEPGSADFSLIHDPVYNHQKFLKLIIRSAQKRQNTLTLCKNEQATGQETTCRADGIYISRSVFSNSVISERTYDVRSFVISGRQKYNDIMKMPEQIETERLVLRKPRMEDAFVLFTAYMQDPEVTRYTTWRPHRRTTRRRRHLFETALPPGKTRTRFPYVITLKEKDDPFGMIDLHIKEQ